MKKIDSIFSEMLSIKTLAHSNAKEESEKIVTLFQDEIIEATKIFNEKNAQKENVYLTRLRNHNSNLLDLKNSYSLNEELKSSIINDDELIIPANYLNDKEVVMILLSYLLDKRANTVTELINLYHDEQFKKELISTIKQGFDYMYSSNIAILKKLGETKNELGLINDNLAKHIDNVLEINNKIDKAEDLILNLQKSVENLDLSVSVNVYCD